MTGVEFIQKLKDIANEGPYAEYKKKLRPFSNSDQFDADMGQANTFVGRANLYLDTITTNCKILKEFDEKYDYETLIMMYKFDRLDALRKQGRLMIARSPNLGATLLEKLCGESDAIQFVKEHKGKRMGVTFLENLESCRERILAEAKVCDNDAAKSNLPAACECQTIMGLSRATHTYGMTIS